jgi:hypothetical protein
MQDEIILYTLLCIVAGMFNDVINFTKTCIILYFLQVFVQKVVPDTDTLILRLASRYLNLCNRILQLRILVCFWFS